MTFVIKDKIEFNDKHQKNNQFDLTPYNYIYNKSSSFLDGNIIFLFKDLANVLQNFERINPKLLGILYYAHEVINFYDEDGR